MLARLNDTRLEAAWLQNLDRAEALLAARLSRRFGSVRLEAGADLIGAAAARGEAQSPFHLYAPNDRFVFRASSGF